MVLPSLSWYLVISLLGLATFPLTFRLLPSLKDRGYAFSRALGLLLWAYFFWLLSSFGMLNNDMGGILFAFVLLLGLVYWSWRKIPGGELRDWFREKWKLLIAVEGLFVLAFIGMILLRGLYPDIIATEKPMELAFINAILRSPSMPPFDPWLADYAISYYYFGYVMVGILAQITGVSGGVAFNLGISLVFSMTAVGAYGIVYNLLAAFQPGKKLSNAAYALLGPLFVLIVSNVEGFLEYLHGLGWKWTQDPNGEWVSRFWTNLGIKDLVNPPLVNAAAGEWRFWWWWRASRVVQDYGIYGNEQEVIDEFPFFSYYLADLHPHVLVMPFVFLAMALALNVYFSKNTGRFRIFNLTFDINRETFLLGTVVFGGLAFLNIWDFPWYVGLFVAAYTLRRAQEMGWCWERVREFFVLGLAFGLAGVAAYLPFYISFSSQAGGILPNLINPTSGAQLWVMFGTLFVPLFFFLIFVNTEKKDWRALQRGILLGVGVGLVFFGASLLLAHLITTIIPRFSLFLDNLITTVFPTLGGFSTTLASMGDFFLGSYGVESLSQILEVGFSRRLEDLTGTVSIVLLVGLALGILWSGRGKGVKGEATQPGRYPSSHTFAALLILFGGMLVLAPEFIYLRDQFGTRMNTIFKFYFQAWMLWGVAAAYGSAVLLSKTRQSPWTWIFIPVLVVVLTVGLSYPVTALKTRVNDFKRNPDNILQLDGTAHFSYLSTDDKAAVAWLQHAPIGTLVEAVGGSYSHYARISTHSGQPSLLGWPGHESQWRGGGEEMGSRSSDIQRLYSTGSWIEAALILKQYGIRYVYLGALERTTYTVNEGKFARFLNPVFKQGEVTIYQVPELDAYMPGS